MSLRVGIIGCGYWGPNLIRNFHALNDVEVAAICDVNSARLGWVKRQYPAIGLATESSEDLIRAGDIDCIVLATPVSTHYELGMQALDQGKHLFVEKPFAATTGEAEALINRAEQKNLRVMVDHTFLYTGAVRVIKEYIDSGRLGDIYYFDSVRVNLGLFQHDVNVIWDLAPHDVSIMDYLLPSRPEAIAATGVAHFDQDIENIAYLSAWHPGNLLGHIHVNWLAPVKVRKTLISGSRKMIIYDDTEPSEKVKIYDRGVEMVESKDEIYDILIQYRTGDMLAPRIDLTEALKSVVGEFYDAINEERAPMTDGHAGLQVVRVLEAANQSIRNGGRVIELT